MTNEQWLVYLWSIYPNGLFIQIWITVLVLFIGFLMVLAVMHYDGYEDETCCKLDNSLRTDKDECSKLELDEKTLKNVLRDAGIFNTRIV